MSVDWNKQPFVTYEQLQEMPSWEAQWFLRQPKIWRPDMNADILRNVAHPDNVEWGLKDLMVEAKRVQDYWAKQATKE